MVLCSVIQAATDIMKITLVFLALASTTAAAERGYLPDNTNVYDVALTV